MSKECLVDFEQGSLMVDSNGVFVGLKLPWCERLPVGVQARLATLAEEWEELMDHIPLDLKCGEEC